MSRFRQPSILPGFRADAGLHHLLLERDRADPLAALIIKGSSPEPGQAQGHPARPARDRFLSPGRDFGAALLAAVVNAIFGFIVAWTLVRYEFPGRRLVDALIDLPFPLPTAGMSIALTAVFAPNGWLGEKLASVGVQVAYTWIGVVVALILIGLPFVVRSVQPALIEVQRDLEDAAETLGASPWQIFRRIILLPAVLPAVLTRFTLAFARGIGEYGSVVFISGNLPMKTRSHTALIVIKLEQFRMQAAAALGLAMLVMSFDHAVRDQPGAGLGAPTSRGGGSLMAGAAHIVEERRRVEAGARGAHRADPGRCRVPGAAPARAARRRS